MRPSPRHTLALIAAIAVSSLAASTAAGAGAQSVNVFAASPSGAIVKVAFNHELRKSILVDARGITLYSFVFDVTGKPICWIDPNFKCVPTWPSCVDDPEYHCVKTWHPLITAGRPRAGKGASQKLLGVARRKDGRLQVTYNRLPLYFFAGGAGPNPPDKKPGDVNGQNFSDHWFVVSPKGVQISTEEQA